jgi:eukaryotic sulfide quinone oxidoreductase
LQHDLASIRADKKQAVFKNLAQDGAEMVVDYDMLHVTPPMSAPSYIKESDLSDAAGWVNVDKETTQHVEYPNIFSLGDSSSLPTSKTAAGTSQLNQAAAAQSGITSQNLLDAIENKPLSAKYDGYTSCPLVTGKSSLILAEFSGYTGKPLETFWFDQSKESQFSYLLKAEVIPKIYWDMMMKGKWRGPGEFRKVTNPFGSN